MRTLYTSKHSLWLKGHPSNYNRASFLPQERIKQIALLQTVEGCVQAGKPHQKCCWCRFIKTLSMKEIVRTTDNQISPLFMQGEPGIIEGSVQASMSSLRAPLSGRFLLWRTISSDSLNGDANIQCPSIWAFTANEWTFSVHFPPVFPEGVPWSSTEPRLDRCSMHSLPGFIYLLKTGNNKYSNLPCSFLCSCGQSGSSILKETLEQW